MATRARASLLEFTRYTFGGAPPYITNWHHELLASELDAVIEGREKRLIIVLPSQVGKSELSTRRAPAYALGRNPAERVIAGTYAGTFAAKFGREVQRIMRTPEYQVLFPDVRLRTVGARETDDAALTGNFFETVDRAGRVVGSCQCVGRGQGVAGNPGTIIFVDDILKDLAEAFSPTVRETGWSWFVGEILRRIPESGRIVVVNTRRHRDDLTGRLLRLQPDVWRVIEIPSLRKAEKTHADDPREEGEALWPRHKSRATLEEEKRLSPSIFAAMDQGDPSEAGGTDWPPELFGDWIWVDEQDWPTDFEMRIVTCDPAKGKSDKQGDYTAFVFLGVRSPTNPGLVFVDAHLERMGMNRIAGKLIAWCGERRPDVLAIEAEQFQAFLHTEVERLTENEFGLQWKPEEITSEGRPKIERIRRLAYLINGRRLRFRKVAGCRLLVEQLLDFPTAEHDDGPDALEMAERMLQRVASEVRG